MTINAKKVLLAALFIPLALSGLELHGQGSVYDLIRFDDCKDVEIQEEPERYVGDDLFSLINGGAELYHEFGFVEVLAAKVMLPAGDSLMLEIYDMGSTDAAWGIYSMTETSSAKAFDAGTAGRRGEGFAQFIQGKYMVYFRYDHDMDPSLASLASCVSAGMGEHHPAPMIMDAVAGVKEEPEKVVYFRGHLGLSSLYSFHYRDVFNFTDGAAAVYPGLKVFVLKYGDEASCKAHYQDAVEFFMNSGKYHEQVSSKGSLQLKDRNDQQLDLIREGSYIMIFIQNASADTGKYIEYLLKEL